MKRNLFLSFILFCFISLGHSQIVYTLSSCGYAPIAGVGTPLPACDDCMSGMVPLGFTFNFYGTNYTQCDITSNGWLTFNAGMGPTYPGQVMPYAPIPTMIAFSWDDMYTVGATFDYFTTGAPPNRIFVLNYNNVGYCCSSSNMATLQVQLYETTNEIRIVQANNIHTGRTATMGIQSGSNFMIVPGRNAQSWAAVGNECQSFFPGPPPPPANDNPCAAIPLTAAYSCIYGTYTNVSATATGGVAAPGCAGYSGGDVWFSVTVPAGGALNFDTQTGSMLDGGMAIYSGPNCSTLSLIAGACDYNSSANGNMPAINLTGLTVGSTVWVRVWENGNDNNGTFGICVVDPNAPVPTMGTGAIYVESNVGSPWGSTSNQDAMNSVFGGAWSMTFFETMNPAAIFVPANCFIFLEGGDGTATELDAFLQANLPLIESWVAMGGRLLLNSAPNEGGNINFGFGGVTLNYDGFTSLGPLGNASPGQAGHPIFNGPFLPCGTAFSGNYFAHSWISGGGTTAIMEDTPGPSLTEKVWGNGRVLFGGWTSVNWATTPFPNITNLFSNMISYQANCLTPLPIELGSFTGTCSNNGTLLNWTTYSEINNASFIVQSSTDGIVYNTESTIQGAGNSNQLLEYSFLSPFRSYPGNYFRLIQKDYNGTEHVYNPIYISCHENTNANCAVVNVNNDEINLSIYAAKDDVFTCTLMDVQGKELVSVTRTVNKGTSSLTFDATQLSAGVYIVLINGTDSQCSNKFIKQ